MIVPAEERRYYSADMAALIDVKLATFTSYASEGRVPAHDGRDRKTGRRFWDESTALAWAAERPGGTMGKAAGLHQQIMTAVALLPEDGEGWDYETVASILRAGGQSVSSRTVRRHMNGECSCLS